MLKKSFMEGVAEVAERFVPDEEVRKNFIAELAKVYEEKEREVKRKIAEEKVGRNIRARIGVPNKDTGTITLDFLRGIPVIARRRETVYHVPPTTTLLSSMNSINLRPVYACVSGTKAVISKSEMLREIHGSTFRVSLRAAVNAGRSLCCACANVEDFSDMMAGLTLKARCLFVLTLHRMVVSAVASGVLPSAMINDAMSDVPEANKDALFNSTNGWEAISTIEDFARHFGFTYDYDSVGRGTGISRVATKVKLSIRNFPGDFTPEEYPLVESLSLNLSLDIKTIERLRPFIGSEKLKKLYVDVKFPSIRSAFAFFAQEGVSYDTLGIIDIRIHHLNINERDALFRVLLDNSSGLPTSVRALRVFGAGLAQKCFNALACDTKANKYNILNQIESLYLNNRPGDIQEYTTLPCIYPNLKSLYLENASYFPLVARAAEHCEELVVMRFMRRELYLDNDQFAFNNLQRLAMHSYPSPADRAEAALIYMQCLLNCCREALNTIAICLPTDAASAEAIIKHPRFQQARRIELIRPTTTHLALLRKYKRMPHGHLVLWYPSQIADVEIQPLVLDFGVKTFDVCEIAPNGDVITALTSFDKRPSHPKIHYILDRFKLPIEMFDRYY